MEDHPLAQKLVGVLLLVMGLACLSFLVVNLGKDLALWVFGREVTGQVDELWVERIGDNKEGELQFDFWVNYHFQVAEGSVITRRTRLNVLEWGALVEGGPIEIVYFPLYPAHNRLEEARYVPILACAYLPIALLSWLGLGLGWYLLGPSRRQAWWFGPGRQAGPTLPGSDTLSK